MSSSRSRLVLELAVERGLLAPSQATAAGGHDALLEQLVSEGVLSRAEVERLELEVASSDDAATVAGASGAGSTPSPLRLPAEDAFLNSWERYQVKRLLGAGGMGRVYEAWDPRLERAVALKFIRSDDRALAARFEREARLQARIENENVCQVFEVGEVEGRLYIAMQLLHGPNLASAHHQMTLREKVEVVRVVAEALHAAHGCGLVHRDVKPANIAVQRSSDGRWHPWVLDFGIARDTGASDITMQGMLLGTPRYMSPEQAKDLPVDHRTDIFSLGASLYEMLGGLPPFGRVSTVEALVSLLHSDPPPLRQRAPDVPRDLEAVVMRCLERDPSRRYATAHELAQDLGRFLDGEAVVARPVGPLRRLGRRARRRPLVLAAAAVALAAVVLWQVTAWQARADAALVHRMTRDVDAVEVQLHTALLAPLHDTGGELASARSSLQEVERQLGKARTRAAGPGHLALARGYLTLGDLEPAERHAEAAWRGGWRDGEAALVYGTILTERYQRERRAATRSADPAVAAARLEAAKQRYRERALELLRQASSANGGSPQLAQALIAFLDGDYELALERSKEAAAGSRWPHEVWRLQGEICLARGGELLRAGRREQAATDLDQAFAQLGRTVEVARSDYKAHLGLCAAWSQRAELEIGQGQEPASAIGQALAACDRAREVRPDDSEPAVTTSAACWMYARFLLQHGRDAAPWLARAEAAARSAIAIAPGAAEGYTRLGQVQLTRGVGQLQSGSDPALELHAALGSLSRALQLEPGFVEALTTTGVVHRWRASALRMRGEDPRPVLREAIAASGQALAAIPGLVPALSSRCTAWFELGLDDEAEGVDPRPAFTQAVADCARAAELNPSHATVKSNLCGATLKLADTLLLAGEPARPVLDQAASACEQAVAINPTSPLAHNNLGLVRQLEAALAGPAAKDRLELAASSLARAIELNPRSAASLTAMAELDLDRARLDLASGASPERDLRSVEASLARASDVGADPGDEALLRAEVALARATAAALAGRNPASSLQAVGALLAPVTAADVGRRAALDAQRHLLAAWWAAAHRLKNEEALTQAGDAIARMTAGVERDTLQAWRSCVERPENCALLDDLVQRNPWASYSYGYLVRLHPPATP